MPQTPVNRSTPPPTRPTSGALAAAHPLVGGVRIDGGPLSAWQARNRSVSIPLAAEQLERAGNLHNLRLATGEAAGDYRGPLFMDSDLYKALEAIAWEIGRGGDDSDLRGFLDAATGLLERAQRPDGYLNSYFQVVEPSARYERLTDSHELYCAGHLIQAALAAHRAAGDERLLAVARRFADHLAAVFGPASNDPARERLDGHPEIETALVEPYRETGAPEYLELARRHVEQRGNGRVGAAGRGASYYQDHATLRERDTMVGHAVRALYLEAGAVDVAFETGDDSLLAASIARWDDMVATKLSLTGGLGTRHEGEQFGDRYELTAERAYNETCASIASIFWSWRLLLATGQSRFADLIERTLWNGFAASTSTRGSEFFYVNPLQRRPDHLDGDDVGRRHTWFSCACCPPNIMRLVASLGAYVATTSGDRLTLHQFAPGRVEAQLPTGRVVVDVVTDYPWDGDVAVSIVEAPAAPWTLEVRKPGWTPAAVFDLPDGQAVAEPTSRGYLAVERTWRPGEQATLRLHLSPRFVRAHHRVDALRGAVALERGPLVYCVEQIDQVAGVDVEDVAVRTDDPVEVQELAELNGVGPSVRLRLAAELRSAADGEPLYRPLQPDERRRGSARAELTAVPYFQWDNRDGGAMRVWLPEA